MSDIQNSLNIEGNILVSVANRKVLLRFQERLDSGAQRFPVSIFHLFIPLFWLPAQRESCHVDVPGIVRHSSLYA